MCFFFKQKTAYEMRISDWSSDVCSSDLEDDSGSGVEERGSRADGVLEVLGEAAVAIDPGEGSLDDPAAWMDDEPGLIGEFADDLDDDRGGVRDTRAVVGAVSEGRSEAHTSELQSLMRISYAVFCLKKKIQPIHT